jgi:hypothetical protein
MAYLNTKLDFDYFACNFDLFAFLYSITVWVF